METHYNIAYCISIRSVIAKSHVNASLCMSYHRLEQGRSAHMMPEYVHEVDHGSFLSLVFSASGGLEPMSSVTYKRLVSLIGDKHSQQ